MTEIKNSNLLIDSDIIIDHLRGIGNLSDFLKNSAKNICYISVVSIAEIYSLLYFNEIEVVERLFSQFKAVHVDPLIARLAGNYRMHFYQTHALTLPDAIIASTAKIINAILLTKNIRHFPMEDIEKIRPY